MQTDAMPISSSDLPARHVEQIQGVLEHQEPDPEVGAVAPSWRRSVSLYAVDAESRAAPRILTPRELGETRAPVDQLICSARNELDRLYDLVGGAGYTVLFCDAAGIAVDHRGDPSDASRFRYWGTWLGGVWSEAAEGTNGIGTCIAEERPITVHKGQHFRLRHIDLSCSGAPIFGIDGRLVAVVDVSAIDPQRSEHAHALTGALTIAAARSIEEQFFREHFRNASIIATAPIETDADRLLLAVDSDHRVTGANRAARAHFQLNDENLREGISLWTIFEPDRALLRRQEMTDVPSLLTVADTGENWPALVTPPEKFLGLRRSPTSTLHTRPRLDLLASLGSLTPPAPAQGGLPPAVLRRVEEYVEAHLNDSIELEDLATVAGLSVFHFARQFKQSAGITPHHYLVRKRLIRARELLLRSDLSLSEIAALTGFSDQSHFTRHFGQMFGMTPGQFRRTEC